jgi:hypothetical protein
MKFEEFQKIPRLSREITVTEKIDGTNAQIAIWYASDVLPEDICDGMIFMSRNGIEYNMLAGSRNKWISETQDNAGFARWVKSHCEELITLGVGHHYGEWWGQGIQRGYGLKEKRFSLFNTFRWLDGGKDGADIRPACCGVVPVLYKGIFDTHIIQSVLDDLVQRGSYASEGFMNPEGVVIYHTAGNLFFKKTIKNDETPKSMVKEE